MDDIKLDTKEINLNEQELKILRKVFEWPKVIETASLKYEPHRIPFYLYELATLFHAYWSKGNEDLNFKFVHEGNIKRKEALAVISVVAIVTQIGMKILGVTLPERM